MRNWSRDSGKILRLEDCSWKIVLIAKDGFRDLVFSFENDKNAEPVRGNFTEK